MPVGNLIAFLAYILQIMFAVMMAVFMVIFIPRAIASAVRLEAVLQTPPPITDPERPITPAAMTGAVEFRGVTVRYPGGETAGPHHPSVAPRPGATTPGTRRTRAGETPLLRLI